jgi:hypothetical protein
VRRKSRKCRESRKSMKSKKRRKWTAPLFLLVGLTRCRAQSPFIFVLVNFFIVLRCYPLPSTEPTFALILFYLF